ncbi:hypothetical protein [Desulfosarcina sp.]|uniref:hypothetical protein n=1 Tax=Desulfosarcina sp. TaxID=2027861 RepID=UPI003562ECE2
MENTLTPAYMPFTYLSESTARILSALLGPVVVYQPLESTIPEGMGALALRDLVEIRKPITRADDRLCAALAEFTDWARMNPGKSTPGTGYVSQRQGEIPFFDETAVNRIRSDINRYRPSDGLADHETRKTEAEFSARLFLALAQENDLATDRLDDDLNQFKSLENVFLDTLKDADEVGFDRQASGAAIWRDDPGAALTGTRIRAWATLAAADAVPPELLVTTSRAVIDNLLETHADALRLDRLADIRLPFPPAGTAPVLSGVLADLANRESLESADLSSIASPADDAVAARTVTVTLFGAVNRTPATVLRRLAPAALAPHEENNQPKSVRHTLIVLVES